MGSSTRFVVVIVSFTLSCEEKEMTTKTVDLTPTWSGILPSLLILLKSESHKSRELAMDELERMATYADNWVALRRQPLTSDQ